MCVFRCYATRFDVDAFLERSPWKPLRVRHRGRKGWAGAREPDKASGFNVDVSRREWDDWTGQVRDATRWLLRHAKEIRRARRAAGAGSMLLDFAYDHKDDAWSVLRLPLGLVERAARLGVALGVCVYPAPSRPARRRARGTLDKSRGRRRE